MGLKPKNLLLRFPRAKAPGNTLPGLYNTDYTMQITQSGSYNADYTSPDIQYGLYCAKPGPVAAWRPSSLKIGRISPKTGRFLSVPDLQVSNYQ